MNTNNNTVEEQQIKVLTEMIKLQTAMLTKTLETTEDTQGDIDSLFDIINRLNEMNERNEHQGALLIDFIEQVGLEDELLKYIDNVAKNERMPAYRDAADSFQEIHIDYLENNYAMNREMLANGSDFLLKPLALVK